MTATEDCDRRHAPKASAKPDLLARYECDGFRFPDRDYYDRHVVFDHVVGMEDADPARAVRGGRPHAPRRPHPALAQDGRDLRPGEPQAGLLPVDGVPDRPVAAQQHRQPGSRAVRPRGPAVRPAAGLEGGARDGTGRRAGQRRPRPAGRLLHRLARDARRSRPSATACGTTTASSGRNSRTATRSSSRTPG